MTTTHTPGATMTNEEILSLIAVLEEHEYGFRIEALDAARLAGFDVRLLHGPLADDYADIEGRCVAKLAYTGRDLPWQWKRIGQWITPDYAWRGK